MATDPLFLLRDHVIHKRPIVFLGADGKELPTLASATDIKLASDTDKPVILPRATPTAYKKSGSTEDYYALDSLVFLAQNHTLVYSSLLKEGISVGISPVSILDMRHLTDFLTGKVETTDNIVQKKRPAPADVTASECIASKQRKHEPHYPSFEAVKNDTEVSARIMEGERIISNHYSVLDSSKDLSGILKVYRDLYPEDFANGKSATPQRGTPGSARTGAASRPNPSPAGVPAPTRLPPPSKRAHRIPLIVVPAAATSLITMYNVQEFLQNHTYVPNQQVRELGTKKESRITLERARIGHPKPMLYHIVDSVEKFKPDDWDRLAAVFTVGATWQFKKWKWEDPREIFKHVKGFYVKLADEKPKDTIAMWNVETIDVDRSKRHKDKAVVSQLWDSLDSYIAAYKPNLMQ
ncbi:accessory factor associated with RNA polymerase II [Tieghemiomyces parasiticus]|uniref:Accessory factor associated with RNA polymerase II n=1 Tax=Tieghemiomyces parasiticus TaxID=78921 RepID=A0A9W8A440_9FUNG|nr:accessory factor associated with RNA polymerase II [Tieghemiomyces parasiticus]